MEAFVIFEGGGAKGLAHAGALRYLVEDQDIEFEGVAGTSAGAIVAALVASGHSHQAIFSNGDSPIGSSPKGILNDNYVEQLDERRWVLWKDMVRDARTLLSGGLSLKKVPKLIKYYWNHRWAFESLSENLGLFDTDKFEVWLETHLKSAQGKEFDEASFTRFEDLPTNLKIISTDIDNHSIKIYSKDMTPDVPVARAVAASIRIPFFFAPSVVDGVRNVDGGLVSNFPAWIFDREREALPQRIPTFGLRLIETGIGPGINIDFTDYIGALVSAAVSGKTHLETRGIENLHIIEIPVSIGTLDLELDDATKVQVVNDGFHGARSYFKKNLGPKSPEAMRSILEVSHAAVLGAIGGQETHLRLNVILPTSGDKLKVIYVYNFDSDLDTDDQLELSKESGGCGQCIAKHVPVNVDLVDAASTFQKKWKMTKYQQALVRRDLKSLLCVPLFDPKSFDPNVNVSENCVIGTLNFDSREDLTVAFSNPKVIEAATLCARLVADKLMT